MTADDKSESDWGSGTREPLDVETAFPSLVLAELRQKLWKTLDSSGDIERQRRFAGSGMRENKTGASLDAPVLLHSRA
jgi:hypothetical protein